MRRVLDVICGLGYVVIAGYLGYSWWVQQPLEFVPTAVGIVACVVFGLEVMAGMHWDD